MKITTTVFLTLLLIGSGLTVAVNAETVTVRGEATIFNGDIPAAREEALIAAKRNAVEKVLGVNIKAESAVQDFMLADDAILTMTEGYVTSSKIISEKQENEYLVLEVECNVADRLPADKAAELMRNFSAVVGITTEIDGRVRNDDDRLSNKLVAELVKAGYDVRDATQLLALKGFQGQLLAASKHQDIRAARWIGQQLLSNIVIVGNARLEEKEQKTVSGFAGDVGVVVYDCWLDARAIETESGQIIAQVAPDFEGVQGSGKNQKEAVTDALTKAEKAFSADLMNQLALYAKRKTRTVTVEVMGIPSYEEYQRVKTYLNNIRFRESEVSDLGFDAGRKSTFSFMYGEKMNLIALKLDHLPYLTVVERTENRVLCRYFKAD